MWTDLFLNPRLLVATRGLSWQCVCFTSLHSLPCSVRRLQLCVIFLELAPKYLLEMFKHFVVLCEDFKGVCWDEKERSWLVGRMKKNGFTNREVTDKPVAEWDVSALYVALQAVSIPSEVYEKVKKVKTSRNATLHGQGASCDDLETRVEDVRSLIEMVRLTFPDQPWEDYLKELDSAADSEFHSCYGVIRRSLHGTLVLWMQRGCSVVWCPKGCVLYVWDCVCLIDDLPPSKAAAQRSW